MTDEADGDADPLDEAPLPDDAPPTTPASQHRDLLNVLDAFAAIQRQLAAADFTALTTAQRAIEAATPIQIPSIVGAQDAVAKSFGRSVDFSHLAETYRSLMDVSARTVAVAAQKQWAESLGKAINFSALRDAIASSAALTDFSGKNQELTEALKTAFSGTTQELTEALKQLDRLAGITEGIAFKLPALDRWIPTNLRSVEHLDVVATVALDEGLPLSWVPRTEITVALIEADGPEARLRILSERRDDILDDCEAALGSITHEWAVQCRSAIAAIRLGVDGPAQSHASNIVDSIVLALHGKERRRHAKDRALDNFDELPLQLAAENLTLRPLFRAFAAWRPDSAIPPPDYFARHWTSHAVGNVGVFAPLSALIAVMLATSLTVQYAPAEPTDSDSDASR